MVLRSVGVFSLAKVMGALYAVIGFIIGAIFALFGLLGAGIAAGQGEGGAIIGLMFGAGATLSDSWAAPRGVRLAVWNLALGDRDVWS